MTDRTSDVETTTRLRFVVVGAGLIVLAAVVGMIAAGTPPLGIDVWWNRTVADLAPGLLPLSLVLDYLGGGWVATFVVPLGGAMMLLLARRRWSAAYFLAASVGSVALVQILKALFGRPRPEEMIVVSDFGSFPSGHTANAATIAAVAVIVFPRLWIALVGAAWIVLMAFGRTQVHAHWLTDTVGGAAVGVGAALVVAGVFATPILRERSLG